MHRRVGLGGSGRASEAGRKGWLALSDSGAGTGGETIGGMASGPGVRVVRVGRADRVSAAARLVGGDSPNARQAGRAFLDRAGTHGIDLRYFWGVPRERTGRGGGFSQAMLVVPQTGRTAMVFLSGPGAASVCGHADRQNADRVGLLGEVFEQADVGFG